MMIKAPTGSVSKIGASGTVTKTIGSRMQQIFEVGTQMLLKRTDPTWRQLYTPLTNAIALSRC